MIIWLIGISGAGKTTIGKELYSKLKKRIKNIIFLDGDLFRELMNNDIGYSQNDRNKNEERMIKFAEYLLKQKINIIVTSAEGRRNDEFKPTNRPANRIKKRSTFLST